MKLQMIEGYPEPDWTEAENRIHHLAELTGLASQILSAELDLMRLRRRLRTIVQLNANDPTRCASVAEMRLLLGHLYPSEVEEVREGAEVAQEGVVPPEPEASPLGAQEARSAVEVRHPVPGLRWLTNEPDCGAVGNQQER